jgi:NAD(P)-dependent dehydrogenase (short-subunit alcohol dehydrogenase family)
MRNIVISGSASGIGLACRRKLESLGDRVIGIDIRDAEIIADLSTPEGRRLAIDAAREQANNEIDGLVLSAGVSGMQHAGDFTVTTRPISTA